MSISGITTYAQWWSMDDIVTKQQDNMYTLFANDGKITLENTPFQSIELQNILIQWAAFHIQTPIVFQTGFAQKTGAYFAIDSAKNIIIDSDIPIHALPSLILTLNTSTFHTLPAYAASEELQSQMKAIIWYLYDQQTQWNTSIVDDIKKYQKLLHDTYQSVDTAWHDLLHHQADERFMHQLTNTDRDPESTIATSILDKTFEWLYEHGVFSLTQMESIKNISNFARLKEELAKVRTSGTAKQIADKERSIIWNIITTIIESDLQREVDPSTISYLDTSIPTKIIESNEISCVWLSLLLHQFFLDLNIPHKGVIIKWHAALVVITSDQKTYYCDASTQTTNHFEEIDYDLTKNTAQEVLIGDREISITLDDVENVLMSQIAYNTTMELQTQPEKKLLYLRLLLSMSPLNHVWRYQLAASYYEQKEYNKARDAIHVANAIDPHQWTYYFLEEKILVAMKDFWPALIEAKENKAKYR